MFESPLRIAGETRLQTVVRSPIAESPGRIEIYSAAASSDSWSRHFSATVDTEARESPERVNRHQIAARCPVETSPESFYESVDSIGLQYSREFRTIRALRHSETEVLASLRTEGDQRGYVIPPTLLDGALQSLAIGLLRDEDSAFFLPVGMERFDGYRSAPAEVYCHARWCSIEDRERTADLTLFDQDGEVIAQIDKLRLRAVNRAVLRQISGAGSQHLAYHLAWNRAELGQKRSEVSSWLVIREESIGENPLAVAMAEQGQRCIDVRLRQEEAPAEMDGETCTISAGDRGQWEALLSEYFPAESGAHLDGVVWLIGDLEEASPSHRGVDRTRLVCSGVLGLVQALRGARIEQLGRGFQFVTRDGVATDDGESVLPETAQFWGLGRVLSAEYPGLRCRLIDTDGADASIKKLVDTVLTESRENQIAIRAAESWVPRLVPQKLEDGTGEFAADPQAAYLITGGLGSLGRQAARWLARRGAGHLVLVSRSRPDEVSLQVIEEIEQSGCRVHVRSVDIADRDRVTELLSEFGRELPRLRGVIHAAGVLDDGLLADQTWSRFETVLAAKKEGARLLDEATRESDLDLFVLYSSAASIMGSPGQGNYATANAYLDALAQSRRAAGLHALSVNWGPWNEGMAASDTVVKSFEVPRLDRADRG